MKTKSIADILGVILFAARIIIWIVLGALIIAGIALGAALLFQDQLNEIPNVSAAVDFEKDDWGDLISFSGVFIGFVIALKVVNRLLEISRSISRATPFEKQNGGRLSQIAKYLVIGQVLQIILSVVQYVLGYNDGEFRLSLTMLLAAAIAAVLAEVFREGTRLREEQEFTV